MHTQRIAQFTLTTVLALVLAACSDDPVQPEVPHFDQVAPASLNTDFGEDLHATSELFPSTNEQNHQNEWSHVLFKDVGVGNVTLEFNQPRWFAACFEYRVDGEEPVDPTGNFNPGIDELWAFHCLGEAYDRHTLTETFHATEHVDVRLAFGAESSERFDWTRFYVLSLENKDQCRQGEWQEMGFRNQGQCVRWVETGKDSRAGG